MRIRISIWIKAFGVMLILFSFIYYIESVIYSLNKSVPFTLLLHNIKQRCISNPLIPLYQLIYFICGMGVIRFQEWARKFVVYISFIGFLLGMAAIIFLAPFTLYSKISLIFWNMLFYIFFSRPKVKKEFSANRDAV